MTLQKVRLALTLLFTSSLFMNQSLVTAFQSPSKIRNPSVTHPTPPCTTFGSNTRTVVDVDHRRNTLPIAMAFSACLLSTMIVVLQPLPAWSQPNNIAKGEVLFQANCAGCHAGGNNYVAEKRTLLQDDILKYRGSTDQTVIANFVQNGMPHKLLPMKVPMDEKDYNDVVAYVLDQALGEKW